MFGKKDVPATRGFLFLKTFKTASSTSAGVNLRIAKSVAQRHENHSFPFCQARFDHAKRWDGHGTLFANRTLEESFLWAILREPTKRVISQFFHFQVSRAGVSPTNENFRKFVKRDMFKNYYLRSLSMRRVRRNETNDHTIANEIMQAYNFIGVSERIDEVRILREWSTLVDTWALSFEHSFLTVHMIYIAAFFSNFPHFICCWSK
jgi:hypothetical protein